MRKVLCLLLSLCLLAFLAIGVSADVIWEPYGDSFYDEHRDEMQYENRFYRATADLAQYDEPGGEIIDESVIFADELFNVQYVYEDENGVLWGNCFLARKDSVWVDLVGCVRPYDRTDFREDYENEFKTIENQPDISFYADEVPLYDYPGAANALYNMIVESDSEYLPEYVHTYTDEAGNVWGELMYFRGMSGWVLLNGDISTVKAPDKERDQPIENTKQSEIDTEVTTDAAVEGTEKETTSTATAGDAADPVPKQNFAVPVLLVVAVVAVTLAVLFIFFRKKKK
ncbi:MAG: hypothetical protein E7523_07340 [Ruminococcaceae bacterium]|nr:hypothetical protein [Oscillospiraceae bacterium]